jgi:hypothetical protein
MVFPCAASTAEKPTYGRCFWRLIIACLMATPVASLAQGPGYPPVSVLTEAEAVQLGLTRPEVEALFEGEIDDVLAARPLPNPAFSYSRENSRGATTDSQEDFFWLTQRVDLPGVAGCVRRRPNVGSMPRGMRPSAVATRSKPTPRTFPVVRSDSPISLFVPFPLLV